MGKKVTVVGAGFVGATCARRIIEKDLADVALIDIIEGLPQGRALDLMESAPIEGYSAQIIGTNDYKDTKNSDIVVVTAGIARKPGMSRDDLLQINAKIIKDVVKNIAKFSPNAILIMVTNPLDVMSYLAYKTTKFKSNKVIGMAGVLDSARYRFFIAQSLGITPSLVNAFVLGGHGDSMVPLPRYSTVNGIPITQLLDKEKIKKINERTKNGGAEIVGLLKTGSAYYAPSASVVEMVKSIIFDEHKILPCCVLVNGEYGLNDIYCGLPVKISKDGVEEIVKIDLSKEELNSLKNSSEAVKNNIKKLNI